MCKCHEVWYHVLCITTKVVYASILMAMGSAKAAIVRSDLLLLSWAVLILANIIYYMMFVLFTSVHCLQARQYLATLNCGFFDPSTQCDNECYHYILAMQTVYCDSSLNGSYILFPTLINRHFIVFTLLCYVSLHVGEWKPATTLR